MDAKTFDKIATDTLEKCHDTLVVKAKEYASSRSRLHNFHVAARLNRVPVREALWGMATKHLVSVIDIVNGRECSREVLDEKIGDMINYLILLKAVVVEEMEG